MTGLVVGLLLGVVAAGDKTITLNDFAGDKPTEARVKVLKEEVTVKAGAPVVVRLESNPSTGYRWGVVGPEYGPLDLEKARYEPPAQSRPGAAGVQVFEFTAARKNQRIILVFLYGRPFEGLGDMCYQLRVNVEE